MTVNELGIVLDSCAIRWTTTAKECYKNGLKCLDCKALPDDIKAYCKMKPVVLELVRKYGKPHKEEEWGRK